MRNGANFTKFRDSVEYRPMFKALIKHQIQSLLSQLSSVGEESVLLTACTADLVSADDDVIGSDLGQGFVQERFDCLVAFRDFCFLKTKEREVIAEESKKRKLCETNGAQTSDGRNDRPSGKQVGSQVSHRVTESPSAYAYCSFLTQKGKKHAGGKQAGAKIRAHVWHSFSPAEENVATDTKKVKVERTSSPESGSETRDTTPSFPFYAESPFFRFSTSHQNLTSPNLLSPNLANLTSLTSPTLTNSNTSPFKTQQHKCSQCNYTSKFKANVVRHERSIHGINVEGAPGPTIQYACTLCAYKSLYRSNLMRHEKNVHKLEPVPQEADFSRLATSGLGLGDTLSSIATTGHPRLEQPGLQKDTEQSSFESPSLVATETEEVDTGLESASGNHVCIYCQLVFPTMLQLKEHVDTSHYGAPGKHDPGKSGKYDCGKCRTSFGNLVLFQAHMATHYLNRQEKCICGRTFQYRVSLLKHIPKCVVAKETNFRMSDVVLGSGMDTESAYSRADLDQGACRHETEAGFAGNSSDQGAGWNPSLEGGGLDLNRQGLEQGYRLEARGSEQEQYKGESGCSVLGSEQKRTGDYGGNLNKVFSIHDSEQGNSECELEWQREQDSEQVIKHKQSNKSEECLGSIRQSLHVGMDALDTSS